MEFRGDSLTDTFSRIRTTVAYTLRVGAEYRLSLDVKAHLTLADTLFRVKVKTGETWAGAGDTVMVNVDLFGVPYGEWARVWCTDLFKRLSAATFTATGSPVYVMFGGTFPAYDGVIVSIDNVLLEPAGTAWTDEAALATAWTNESAVTTDWTADTAVATGWS